MNNEESSRDAELEKIWLDVKERTSSDALRRGFFSREEAPRHFLSHADLEGMT